MKRILTQNWQFLLLSQIRRGAWLLDPATAESHMATVDSLLSKNSFAAFTPLSDTIDILAQSEGGGVASALGDTQEEDLICIIPIRGTMFKYGTMCSYGADEYAAMLDYARVHPAVKAVVLDIDSGGGEVASVPVLTMAIERLQKADKPVVASVDFCGSAAYWVASTCDRVYANNSISSSIGSIGVMAMLIDTRAADEKQGIKRIVVYAPQSTDKNLGYRKAMEDNNTYIQDVELKPMAQNFIDAVKANREGKLIEETPGVLSGAMLLAPEAETAGLIDGIKTLDEAIAEARTLADVKSYTNKE